MLNYNVMVRTGDHIFLRALSMSMSKAMLRLPLAQVLFGSKTAHVWTKVEA